MADIQHQDAKKLLKIIASAVKRKQKLTYVEAARRMGRVPPRNHSRAAAQVCDLLDAAACFAGVPLLALVWVLDESGEVNRKAWKESEFRDAIISRSQDYEFGTADYKAIATAIDDLGDRGNRRAWQHLDKLFPDGGVLRRVTGNDVGPVSDAINDLGSGAPDRTKSEVWSYPRDPGVRAAVIQRANGRCELCGNLGFLKPDGTRYLESHHVIALAKDGEDRLSNVLALCPNDHREAHFGEKSKEIEDKMLLKLKAIYG